VRGDAAGQQRLSRVWGMGHRLAARHAVPQSPDGLSGLSCAGLLFHRLLFPDPLAVSVLGRVLPAKAGRPGTDGATAPFSLPAVGPAGPAFAAALSAASAGDVRRFDAPYGAFALKRA